MSCHVMAPRLQLVAATPVKTCQTQARSSSGGERTREATRSPDNGRHFVCIANVSHEGKCDYNEGRLT